MEGLISSNSLSHLIPSSPYYHRPLMTVASNMSTHGFHRFPLRPQPFPPFLGFGEPLSPLDLSVKNTIPITPPCTPSPPRKGNRNENNNIERREDNNNKIDRENDDYEMTEDPPYKIKDNKRTHDDTMEKANYLDEAIEDRTIKPPKITKHNVDEITIIDGQRTPDPKECEYLDRYSPEIDIVNVDDKPKKVNQKSSSALKKNKAVRKLLFDEDKSSPVSGTIIRELADDETLVVRKGDIDPAFNVVEITDEAKATLASIENKLGSYICRLCRQLYEDAFTLAQHRCSRIVHIEYRCPECDKVFNCPANLASHRRWHKPRVPGEVKHRKIQPTSVAHDRERISNDATEIHEGSKYPCTICGKVFRRQAYLKKHLASHSDGEDKDNEKGIELSKCQKEPYDFEDDIKVIDDSFQDKFIKLQSGGHELSAFRQVQSDIQKKINHYELGEEIRDTNFNTFWNKIPQNIQNLGVNYFSYGDNPAERFNTHSNYYKTIQNYEQSRRRYVSSIASESEESQTLDITGSEDERTATDKDISERVNSKMDLESN